MKIGFLLFLSFISAASAQLFDGKEKFEEKYGKPISLGKNNNPNNPTYVHGDMQIFVIFINEKSELLLISKKDSTPLTQDEVDTFLRENSGESTWERVTNYKTKAVTFRETPELWGYLTLDGKRKATWRKKAGAASLEISSADFHDKMVNPGRKPAQDSK